MPIKAQIESPDVEAHIHGQLILTQAQKPHSRERTVSSMNSSGKSDHPQTEKRNKTLSHTIHTNNIKLMKGLMQDLKPKKKQNRRGKLPHIVLNFCCSHQSSSNSTNVGIFKTRNHRHSEKKNLHNEGSSPNERRGQFQAVHLLSHCS